ncbi:DUF6882 domain-containing protein [Deinococcus sedimenti]|uniref:Transcriptional regulator n=1 Tax=Deinococcus sedimenti TaxID=1867090 RepID=A0ABQ2SBG6_9DEIO|nr:DUF6882 domain-containing protein [Deinococcus sedimenti]GGS11133.1 hypothetical protein GCM10008960_41420 [Deinococcus sedimenti]
MSTFRDLLSEHAGPVLLRQQHLADLLGTFTWDADLHQGLLHVSGHTRPYRAQLIGTDMHRDASWLWAWANTGSGLGDEVTEDSRHVREHGLNCGVPELTTPRLCTEAVSGHELAVIACGLTEADAYFRGEFPGGAAYFTLRDVPRAPVLTASRSVHLITTMLQTFALHHPNAIRALYAAHDCPVTIRGRRWTATVGGEMVQLAFDDHQRLSEINLAPATLTPA